MEVRLGTLDDPTPHFALGWLLAGALHAWDNHGEQMATARRMAECLRSAIDESDAPL